MSIKQDVEDAKKEIEDIRENNHSLAWEVLQDMKKHYNRLFICNVLLAIALIISIIF